MPKNIELPDSWMKDSSTPEWNREFNKELASEVVKLTEMFKAIEMFQEISQLDKKWDEMRRTEERRIHDETNEQKQTEWKRLQEEFESKPIASKEDQVGAFDKFLQDLADAISTLEDKLKQEQAEAAKITAECEADIANNNNQYTVRSSKANAAVLSEYIIAFELKYGKGTIEIDAQGKERTVYKDAQGKVFVPQDISPEMLKSLLNNKPVDIAKILKQPDIYKKFSVLLVDTQGQSLNKLEKQVVFMQAERAQNVFEHIRALNTIGGGNASPSEVLRINQQNKLLGDILQKVKDPNVKINAELQEKIFDKLKTIEECEKKVGKTADDIQKLKDIMSEVKQVVANIDKSESPEPTRPRMK